MTIYTKYLEEQRKIEAAAALSRSEWLATDEGKEAAWEMANERRVQNAFSYDPEAYDEMVRDDLMGKV